VSAARPSLRVGLTAALVFAFLLACAGSGLAAGSPTHTPTVSTWLEPTTEPTTEPTPAPEPTPIPESAILSRADVRPVRPFLPVPFRLNLYTIKTLPWAALPYNGQAILSLRKPADSDANGVPYKRVDGRAYYHPGNLGDQGCRYVDAYVRTGNGAYLDRAVVRARTLLRIAVRDNGALYFPYLWSYYGEGLRAPWYSAYSQGFALSLFVRLYRVSGDRAYLDAARATFISFRRLGTTRARWVAYAPNRWLWLEEYPARRPTHVLNGYNFALFGIYDYERLTRDRAARQMLLGALTTMRGNAARYRVPGSISYYDLVHFTQSLHYHRVHIWQLRMLTKMSGSSWFGRLAALLAADAR
jgi:D-glucuronyl C5-epimerase C-terminus